MWQKLKDQIPAIILTALILIGAGFLFYQKTVNDLEEKQQKDITEEVTRYFQGAEENIVRLDN